MNSYLKVGLATCGVTLVMNLLGLLVLQHPAAEFFGNAWWTTWFPVHVVWIVFMLIGLGKLRHDG